MADQFTDIGIVEFLQDECTPSDEGALQKLVLKLEPYPNSDWQNFFNAAWLQHMYMQKRRAWVYGDRLAVVAMPQELETDHLPEFKRVIGEANSAIRRQMTAQNQEQEQRKTAEAFRKKTLQDLKANLKL